MTATLPTSKRGRLNKPTEFRPSARNGTVAPRIVAGAEAMCFSSCLIQGTRYPYQRVGLRVRKGVRGGNANCPRENNGLCPRTRTVHVPVPATDRSRSRTVHVREQ